MDGDLVERAYAHLRSHLSGRLRFDGFEDPLRFIVDPEGLLVASVMVAMLRSFDTVLLLPDELPEALQLQVTLSPLDERGELGHLVDRWQAYHGDPPDVRWARMRIDGAKYEGAFIDGDALVRPNPLAPEEARLCKAVNAEPAAVKRLADRELPIRLDAPVVVGVDRWGLDLRGAFEVRRIAARFEDAAAVHRFVAERGAP